MVSPVTRRRPIPITNSNASLQKNIGASRIDFSGGEETKGIMQSTGQNVTSWAESTAQHTLKCFNDDSTQRSLSTLVSKRDSNPLASSAIIRSSNNTGNQIAQAI